MRTTKAVGRRVEDFRLRQGLTENEFGARCGLSGMTIRRVEAGRHKTIRVRTANAIARQMGLEIPDVWTR